VLSKHSAPFKRITLYDSIYGFLELFFARIAVEL
jgi:hypothetical protein